MTSRSRQGKIVLLGALLGNRATRFQLVLKKLETNGRLERLEHNGLIARRPWRSFSDERASVFPTVRPFLEIVVAILTSALPKTWEHDPSCRGMGLHCRISKHSRN